MGAVAYSLSLRLHNPMFSSSKHINLEKSRLQQYIYYMNIIYIYILLGWYYIDIYYIRRQVLYRYIIPVFCGQLTPRAEGRGF